VEDIDLWTGGISENKPYGGIVGPTFACLISEQFSNIKQGDRFWYENPYLPSSFTIGAFIDSPTGYAHVYPTQAD
jgi:hypothetical protein